MYRRFPWILRRKKMPIASVIIDISLCKTTECSITLGSCRLLLASRYHGGLTKRRWLHILLDASSCLTNLVLIFHYLVFPFWWKWIMHVGLSFCTLCTLVKMNYAWTSLDITLLQCVLYNHLSSTPNWAIKCDNWHGLVAYSTRDTLRIDMPTQQEAWYQAK